MQIETKLGVFSPETVKQAYVKLGYTPNNMYYLNEVRKCGCALGVFIEANAPGVISELQGKIEYDPRADLGNVLGLSYNDFRRISTGFHGYPDRDDELAMLGNACREAVYPRENEND
jgi:hypothetical protein